MPVIKEARLLRIGVLGCGPIAQIAHFDACRKARNAELYAICDVADELRAKMVAVHEPKVAYRDYEEMLADPQVEAIIVAVADQFHVPMALKAVEAGKHVLVEKPLGVNVEEVRGLRRRWQASGLVFQVGNNWRFDPGFAFARHFIREEMGQLMALKAWYYDSIHRYTMTDNLQPIPFTSPQARRPAGNPKTNLRRYFMLAHGSHLVDMARFLGGELIKIQARLVERFESYGWFIAVEFADGSLGHLDLIIPIRGDFEVGFQVYGKYGSARGRGYLPWYHKSSEVECFSVKDDQFHRPLGQDAYSYKLQIEGFADTILHGAAQHGATLEDGLAAVRAMAAISQSVDTGEWVEVAGVQGEV